MRSVRFVALALLVAACNGQALSRGGIPDGRRDASASGAGGTSDASASGTGGTSDASASGTGGTSDASKPGTGGTGNVTAPGTGGVPWFPDVGALAGKTDEQSGTRVQVIDWFSEDVPVARKELFDTEKNVPCEIGRTDDGVWRCLPVSQGGVVGFLDDRCTLPVIREGDPPPPGCPTARSAYVTYPAFASCPFPRRYVVVRGSVIDPPSALYWGGSDGECRSVATSTSPLYEAIASPPADWAAFDRQVIPIEPGLGLEMYQGQDGSRIHGTPRYMPEDVECAANGCQTPPPYDAPLEGPSYCIPAHPAQFGPWSSNASCSQTDWVVGMPKCDPQPFTYNMEVGGEGGCTYIRRVRRVGSPVTSIWLNFFGNCTSWDAVATDQVFAEPGSPMPTTDFPRLDFVRSTAGALERLGWVAPGGDSVLPSDRIGWSSAAAGSVRICTPGRLADGTYLCVPPNTGFGGWEVNNVTSAYSDPACSTASTIDVFALEMRYLPGLPEVGQWIVTDSASPCMSNSATLRQITARHQGTVYGRQLGFCVELPDFNWFVADLGPPRPARDMLPHLTARAL